MPTYLQSQTFWSFPVSGWCSWLHSPWCKNIGSKIKNIEKHCKLAGYKIGGKVPLRMLTCLHLQAPSFPVLLSSL